MARRPQASGRVKDERHESVMNKSIMNKSIMNKNIIDKRIMNMKKRGAEACPPCRVLLYAKI